MVKTTNFFYTENIYPLLLSYRIRLRTSNAIRSANSPVVPIHIYRSTLGLDAFAIKKESSETSTSRGYRSKQQSRFPKLIPSSVRLLVTSGAILFIILDMDACKLFLASIKIPRKFPFYLNNNFFYSRLRV